MKPRPSFKPYMSSADIGINASITLAKLFNQIRIIDPTYKPSSRFQMRLKHKRAVRRVRLPVIR